MGAAKHLRPDADNPGENVILGFLKTDTGPSVDPLGMGRGVHNVELVRKKLCAAQMPLNLSTRSLWQSPRLDQDDGKHLNFMMFRDRSADSRGDRVESDRRMTGHFLHHHQLLLIIDRDGEHCAATWPE